MPGVPHGVRGAAAAAEEQAGEKVLRAVCAIERDTLLIARHGGAHVALLRLDPPPRALERKPS